MALVVVLQWDATVGRLEFVPVNGGSGGAVQVVQVSGSDARGIDALDPAMVLPQVAEVELADGVCLLQWLGRGAVRCSAEWRNELVVFKGLADRLVVGQCPPSVLGVDDRDSAINIKKVGDFLHFGQFDGGVVGCWVRPGGLSGWLVERLAARQRTVEATAERKSFRDRFVNPYTFVPFAEQVSREVPQGHGWLGKGRWAGCFRVRWTVMSPLQAPDGSVSGQVVRLPGSSVKGAVRSLHEVLAGGCVRVVDAGFVPSYRDAAAAEPEPDDDGGAGRVPEWTLVVAREVTRDGQLLSVQVCDQVVWVRAPQLRRACGQGLATGSRVEFETGSLKWTLGRWELPEDVVVRQGRDWTVLITSEGARKTSRNRKPNEHVSAEKLLDGGKVRTDYFAACGHLGEVVLPVGDEVWREFLTAAAGGRELREHRTAVARGQAVADAWRPVRFGPAGKQIAIGRRKAFLGGFDSGDVLWARVVDGVIEGLRLSALWRHSGRGSLGDRIPAGARACTDVGMLCMSCRLFGAVDTTAQTVKGPAQQRGYAGHVRFSDAISEQPVTLAGFERAPLRSPQPGAGQFYLELGSTAPARTRQSPPTREWGAGPDQPVLRMMRGRKAYWHADPTRQQVPRHLKRDHQRSTPAKDAADHRLLAPVGTVLVQTVTFDNVSSAELGGLLATFDPATVLPAQGRALWLRLGGGKPLGLGSCTAQIDGLQVWSADSRYGDGPAPHVDAAAAAAEFAQAVPDQVRERVWPALTAVLSADSVNPKFVWYPPGEHWAAQRDEPKTFDEPFSFFAGTSGMFLEEGTPRPLQALPDPTGADQSLPIIRKADLDKGGGGR